MARRITHHPDSEKESDYKLLKAFDEFIQLNSVEDYE